MTTDFISLRLSGVLLGSDPGSLKRLFSTRSRGIPKRKTMPYSYCDDTGDDTGDDTADGGFVCETEENSAFAATQCKTSVTKCDPNCPKLFQIHPTMEI